MSKWADFVIVAVRYDKNDQYITKVKQYKFSSLGLINLQIESRQTIVDDLNRGKTFVTATRRSDSKWIKGADVLIYQDSYIRTSSNLQERDNLENLPRF